MAHALVRPATAEDVDEIVRIQSSTWRTAYAEFVPEEALQRLSAPAAHEAWAAAVTAGSGHHVLVASEGEWTVGFCAAAPARVDDPEAPARRGQIVTLLVEPRWGRRGHGRRLLSAAFEALVSDGATEGVAWVPEPDVASRACYDRIGWDPDGLVRTLDAGDRELREIRLAGPLRIEDRDPRRQHAAGSRLNGA
jgi:L-amino acid N-acyltransferase YncA